MEKMHQTHYEKEKLLRGEPVRIHCCKNATPFLVYETSRRLHWKKTTPKKQMLTDSRAGHDTAPMPPTAVRHSQRIQL